MTGIQMAEGQGSSTGDAAVGWLVVVYQPTALFSLRTSNATSSGGKTLLVPSPYAIKLAIVDAGVRIGGVAQARTLFELSRSRSIRLRPPQHAVVNNTFLRILRQRRGGSGSADPPEVEESGEQLGNGPYERTIAYREFCHFSGTLSIALNVDGLIQASCASLVNALAHINYFGKRGSFMQFLRAETLPNLPPGFSIPFDDAELPDVDLSVYGLPQMLDDLGEGATDLFDRINTYSRKRITGRERIGVYTLLPYRQRASTRDYTAYRRSVSQPDDLP